MGEGLGRGATFEIRLPLIERPRAAVDPRPESRLRRLLDIGLPVMNGYELAQRFRSTPELAGVRLVALTGYGKSEDQQRTKAAGFDEHLVKPVDAATLNAALAPAAGGKR